MTKEQKCTSFPLAQELQKVAKENGFELPESEYVHCKNFWLTKWKLKKRKDATWGSWVKDGDEYRVYPAPDTSELGAILPGNVGGYYFQTQKGMMGNLFYCSALIMEDNRVIHQEEDKSEANVRCKMLIYLISNKLI